jgi:hypothetical protein
MLGGAALVLHLIGGALIGVGFDLFQRMVQRIGIELGGLLGADRRPSSAFSVSAMR